MSITSSKNLDQLASFFLAEVLRSRKTSLRRAAEISHRILTSISSTNSESEALAKLVEIEKDFEEVSNLKKALRVGHEYSDTELYAKPIKEYASQIFSKDMVLSATFLQDAVAPEMTIQQLCVKYPDFCNFLLSKPGAPALEDLQSA